MSSPAPVVTAVLKRRKGLVRLPVAVAVPEVKPVVAEPKKEACPHCGKLYVNVKEHITKTHKTNRLVWQETEVDGEIFLDVKEFCYEGITWDEGLFGWGDVGSSGGKDVEPVTSEECGVPETAEFRRKFGKGWTHLYIRHGWESKTLQDISLYNSATHKHKYLYIHTVEVIKVKKA
jgi:hypothetical protein